MSLITSENQIVCFPSSVLTVFWCYAWYTVLIVFWKMLIEPVNAPSRWWHCACLKCVSGLRRLEKTLNFLRCIHVIDLVLKYGWHKWRKLVTASILPHCIDGCVASDIGMSFFSYVSGFRLKFFSYCTLTETFAIGFCHVLKHCLSWGQMSLKLRLTIPWHYNKL